MERGTIPVPADRGGVDLHATIESGQTYRWVRSDGAGYGEPPTADLRYRTVLEGTPVEVRETDGGLAWRAPDDPVPALRRALRLEDDLTALAATAPEDPLVRSALEAHRGLRLVTDPPVTTLVSFICSTQMRVERIHRMVTALAETYGTPHELDGSTVHAFPDADALAETTEAELRELGLGYRAPYVRETARMIADGERDPATAADRPYEEAREALTAFVGVGPKVADCVCLFSLGHDRAVPLDTWIQQAIEHHYPDCDRGSYAETARAIQERFGGDIAGYVQTYVFHHLRTGAVPPEIAASAGD